MHVQPTTPAPELDPGPLSERITCRHCGWWKVTLEAIDFEEQDPFDRVHFGVLMRSAVLEVDTQGNAWTIERPGWFSLDIQLLREGHVIAVAKRTMLGLGRRYLLCWEGQELELVGTRGTLSWEILAQDSVLGQVRQVLGQPRTFDVEMPAGTPDELLVFVGALVIMVQRSPLLRLLELLTASHAS